MAESRVIPIGGTGKETPEQLAQKAAQAVMMEQRKAAIGKFATLHARKLSLELEMSGLPPEAQVAICLSIAGALNAEHNLSHKKAAKALYAAEMRSRASIANQAKGNKGLDIATDTVADIPGDELEPGAEVPPGPEGAPAPDDVTSAAATASGAEGAGAKPAK